LQNPARYHDSFVGSLSVAQRRSHRRTRDDLNETVQELKKTNAALGASEAYLAEAQTLSHTGSFGWKVSTGVLFWSEESFRIFAYERTLKPTVPGALERVHPEDVHLLQEALDGVSRGRALDLEHRSVMPDGSIKRVQVLGDVSQKPIMRNSVETGFDIAL
jgi:PAS domain-containing protein